MIQNYTNYYENNFTRGRFEAYKNDFVSNVGKLYSISTGPYFLKKSNADRIKEDILPALMKLLDSKEYQHSVYERGWFLPKYEVQKRDFFGSADFHIEGDEIRLIELNFFIPGHFGLIELFAKLFSKNFDIEMELFADGFEHRLAEFLLGRFGSDKIAICVNHLGRSTHYMEHYKYVEKFLNKNGVKARVVFAKDAKLSKNGKPMWGDEEFDGVFNVVIPRNWEHNAHEFENYTKLFCAVPELFFPNPWCWTIGDKRFLTVLSELKIGDFGLDETEISALKSITLKSRTLKEFSSVEDIYSTFGSGENMVLKPIDNYHTEGVYIEPSPECVQKVFENEANTYIAQELFKSEKIYYENENAEVVEPWRAQLRVEFFDGEFSNFRAYGFSDPFGLSPMMPVIVAK